VDSDEDVDQVPAKTKAVKAPVEQEVDDEDDEDEPDEYQVETILKHDFTEDGAVLYQIKWLGYDKKSDYTWEPLENLYVQCSGEEPGARN
jgi:chromobox protein 1